MKNKKLIFLMVAMVMLFTHCDKDDSYTVKTDNIDTVKIKEEHRVCFQIDYINYAWGYLHLGWIIDTTGNVYGYHNPENWIFPDSLGYITATAMDSNLLETDSVCYSIDKKTVLEKMELISKAAEGSISDPVYEMWDAGETEYLGFQYNADTKTYKKTLIKKIGDYRLDNSSPQAEELYQWLDTIAKQMWYTQSF